MKLPNLSVVGRGLLLACTLGALFIVLGPTQPTKAQNAVITVTTANDATPDGCDTASCSLREAIIKANSDPGLDTIVLAANTTYNIALAPSSAVDDTATGGDFDITDDLIIQGQGIDSTIISGSSLDRVFEVDNGDLTLNNLTIQNGFKPQGVGGDANKGGGVYYSADRQMLTLSQVKLTNNQSNDGAGLYNDGQEAIINIINSVFEQNIARSNGGAISVAQVALADVNIVGSGLIGNTAGDSGGAIFFLADTEEGEKVVMNLINTTVSSNTAAAFGGGVANRGTGQVNLQNTTIVYNQAGDQQDGGGGGISAEEDARYEISHTIIANNIDNRTGVTVSSADCSVNASQYIHTWGYNIISNASSCNWPITDAISDTLNTDPLLNSTLTGTPAYHTVQSGSPAIGQGGSDFGGKLGQCMLIDQRGHSRQTDNSCDIGAYEASDSVTPALSLLLVKNGPDKITQDANRITYTINAINASPLAATNAVITDVVPKDTNYVEGGTLSGNTVSWSVASMPVSSLTPLTFVITATDSALNEDFGVQANGYATTLGFNRVETTFGEPEFTISKTGPSSALTNQTFEYIITVQNIGDDTALNVVVTDTVPAGATFVSSSGGDSSSLVDGVVRWEIGSISSQSGNSQQFRFSVTAENSVVNSDYRVSATGGYSKTGTVSVTTEVADGGVYMPIVIK